LEKGQHVLAANKGEVGHGQGAAWARNNKSKKIVAALDIGVKTLYICAHRSKEPLNFFLSQGFIVNTGNTPSAYRCFGSGALVHAGFGRGQCGKFWALPKHACQQAGHASPLMPQLSPQETDIHPGEGRA
jgi:hypothetical protein